LSARFIFDVVNFPAPHPVFLMRASRAIHSPFRPGIRTE
jgi:hypothetical protein